jgi:5-methylcytosine-specific restriction endonuclease McrA
MRQFICGICYKIQITKLSRQKYCGSWKKDTNSCSYKSLRLKSKISRQNKYDENKHNPNYLPKLLPRNYARKKKKDLAEIFNYTCQLCKTQFPDYWYLDIDHKDGNRQNNDISNLWTLCPTCHRIKTFTNKEYLPHLKRNSPNAPKLIH